MGNSLTNQEKEEKEQIINLLCKLDLDTFDSSNRVGSTGYIDFIKPDELDSNVKCVKGIDKFGRKFFVFKAKFIFANENFFDTFSIFFQRYTDNELLWMCCGNYKTYLMNTEGGTNNSQLKLIYELLKEGKIKLNKEICLELRLNFTDDFDIYKMPDSKYPIELILE